ncbi:hypothetical protein [uncultured Tateyamaria sp.]|uniref:hypothetical protein n=1 Tax=uncultured Tateyamaria sp. TaxID=455651 RepID=UPI00261CE69B|nr:hypothetical protein [uncultured Tateyamaria sp.]
MINGVSSSDKTPPSGADANHDTAPQREKIAALEKRNHKAHAEVAADKLTDTKGQATVFSEASAKLSRRNATGLGNESDSTLPKHSNDRPTTNRGNLASDHSSNLTKAQLAVMPIQTASSVMGEMRVRLGGPMTVAGMSGQTVYDMQGKSMPHMIATKTETGSLHLHMHRLQAGMQGAGSSGRRKAMIFNHLRSSPAQNLSNILRSNDSVRQEALANFWQDMLGGRNPSRHIHSLQRPFACASSSLQVEVIDRFVDVMRQNDTDGLARGASMIGHSRGGTDIETRLRHVISSDLSAFGYQAEEGDRTNALTLMNAVKGTVFERVLVDGLMSEDRITFLSSNTRKALHTEATGDSNTTQSVTSMMRGRTRTRQIARPLESYMERLNIPNAQSLHGKNICLVGGGISPVRQSLRQAGVSAQVTNVDLSHRSPRSTADRSIVGDFTSSSVGAQLAAYDEMLCLYSLPMYCKESGEVRGFFKNALSHVNPGGNVRVFPMSLLSNDLREAIPSVGLIGPEIEQENTRVLLAIASSPIFTISHYSQQVESEVLGSSISSRTDGITIHVSNSATARGIAQEVQRI